MKLFITGALGHIGSRLIHSIKPGEFDEVVLMDNMSTQRYCSLFNLPMGVPFRFIEDDVCTANLESYLTGIDIVLHLAAITNAAGSFEIQDQVEKVNFSGTERIAKACIKTGTKLIFLSTTSVYGTQEKVVDEMCTPEELKPQSPYAESKFKAEQLLKALGEKEGLKFIVCRFGTIFGTSVGMRFHTAINKFCWQACIGQPITVWRTALHQKRPYLDLSDAVEALRFIMNSNRFDKKVYNVLTINATVNDIIDKIKGQISDVKIEFVDTKIMNQLSYIVANEGFKKIGFKFEGSLDCGVSDTIKLIQNIHRHE
jgi:nucleoside-diphosphate-sugar epimerase